MNAIYAAVIVFAIYNSKLLDQSGLRSACLVWNFVIVVCVLIEVVKFFAK